MTAPARPIATTYVEVRTAPGAKQQFKRDVESTVTPTARGMSQTMQQALRDGLRTPAGAAGAGAAIGTVVGQGLSRAVAAAIRGGTSIFRTGIAEVKEYQAGLSQLAAGIKSTGGAAGLSARQMEQLASAVQEYSGQTDDSIVKAESLLLTFDKIRDAGPDKIFTRATKASADLAQRMGVDASSGALQLGKSLQDPVRGMTALTRSGIIFSEQQRKTIKSLVETGHQLEAQKLILTEVEKQVGGSARAFGDTLPGKVERSHRAFEDLSQHLLGNAAPALEAVAVGTRSVVNELDRVGPVVPIIIGALGTLYVATKAVKAYREVRDTLFARQGARIAGNLAEAESIDAIAAAEVRAAGAAELPRRGLGGGGGGLRAGVGTVGRAGVIGAAAAGIFGLTTEGLRRGDEREALRQGLIARGGSHGFDGGRSEAFARDLLHRIGSKTIDDATGYTADLAAYRKQQQDRALQLALTSRLSHEALIGPAAAAAEQRLARSRSVLAAAQAARRDPNTLRDNGVIGAPFDELPNRHPNNPAEAAEQLRASQRDVRQAKEALDAARAGGPGATSPQLARAQAAVLTARDASRRRGGNAEAEQLRLQAAESRLAELRAKGGSDADKVREAEDRLAEARRKQTDAAKALHDAEKGTALSPSDVLARITGQAKNAQALREDAKSLIQKGVSKPVLEALEDLEKAAPGTLDNLARSLTPAMAKALNKQQAALAKATYEFHDAARVAGIKDAIAAVNADKADLYGELARAQASAYQRALQQNLFAGLEGPVHTTSALDPDEHGAPMTVVLQGQSAQRVRQITTAETARAGRQAAMAIGRQG